MNVPSPSPGAGRIALAVVAGLLLVIVLSTAVDAVLHASHVFPAPGVAMAPPLWWLALGYRAAFTFLGGWATARIAFPAAMRAVVILTAIGAVLGLLGLVFAFSHPDLGPLWYAWAVAISGPLSSLLGGFASAAARARKESR